MSEYTLLIGILALFVAVMIGAWEWWESCKGPEEQRSAVIMGYLPVYFIIYLVYAMVSGGSESVLLSVVTGWFGIFLHIAVYYALLLPILPLFRKTISAKACAGLWTLPAFLYIFMRRPDNGIIRAPRVVLLWPGWGIKIAAVIWAMGVLAVMVWHTVNHLTYRRELLRDAEEVCDSEIAALWQEMQQEFGIEKADISLIRSPAAKTPLTIGLLSHKTMRVVLPKRDYTTEELRLIFRHELIHIQRSDCWTKLYLLFYAAMCWFLPLMWIAMRRSADDLELSCDEGVLEGADEESRRKYAELILSSVGDQRGYTTCLSASASALRYRLKNIVQPRRRFTGAVTMALVAFALIFTVGNVGLAYGGIQGKDLPIHGKTGFSAYTLRSAVLYPQITHGEQFAGQEELPAYLDTLTFYEVTGGDGSMADWGQRRLGLNFEDAPIGMDVCFYEHAVTVNWYELHTTSYQIKRVEKHYYVKDLPDWTTLLKGME